MTAYLGLYADVRKYLLAEGDHRHEVGEDTSRCRNCLMIREAAKMSPFEAAAWRWYNANMTPLVVEAGLMGRMLDRLGMGEVQERIFLRAVNYIRQFVVNLQMQDARN